MEEGNSLISICMPAYNAEKYIREAIKSVLQQSYSNIELIVVNDGSTDRTQVIIDEFDDPRIIRIHNKNSGQCVSANLAFYQSRGSFIKFFDADDILSKDMLKNQIALIKEDPDAIAISSWGRFYKDDLESWECEENITTTVISPIEWIIKSMTNRQIMLQCGMWLIPRNILLKSGLWNENLTLINDFEFMIRVLLKANRIKYADQSKLYYRSGIINSLSGLKSRIGAESSYSSITLGLDCLLDFENNKRTRLIAANTYQHFIYEFYPRFSYLTKAAQKKINLLGGSDLNFVAGGITLKLSKLFGWKLIKRIKNIL